MKYVDLMRLKPDCQRVVNHKGVLKLEPYYSQRAIELATVERPEGYWKKDADCSWHRQCSVCGFNEYRVLDSQYCPNCGSLMVSPYFRPLTGDKVFNLTWCRPGYWEVLGGWYYGHTRN